MCSRHWYSCSPSRTDDESAWVRWMDGLLSTLAATPQLGERVRFVVPRTVIEPVAPLVQHHPNLVCIVHGKYSMASVPRELLAESGERGSSGEFRRLFVTMSETVKGGNPARLEALRAAALEVAGREVVRPVRHRASDCWRRISEMARPRACRRCISASSGKRHAVNAGHPAGWKLVANGLFGEASVHLMVRDHARAAYCYERGPRRRPPRRMR